MAIRGDTVFTGIWTTPIYKGSISLSTTWTGAESPYSQTVTVLNIGTLTNKSKVDLQPSVEQMAQLIEDGVVALLAENNNGTVTVYAFGEAPTTAMTMQCTVMETV